MILSAFHRLNSVSPLTVLLIAGVFSASSLMVAAPSQADPAVKEANVRIVADYNFDHVNSNDAFQYTPPPTTLGSIQEVDIDSGGFTGIFTFPVAEAFGVRVYGGPTFSKTSIDQFATVRVSPLVSPRVSIERFGLDVGGDVFWRDPNVGEAGIGTFYQFSSVDAGNVDDEFVGAGRSINRSEHTAGVHAYGKLFLDDFIGYGPLDLDLSANFSDSNIDDHGSLSAERTYTTRGGARLYPNDHFALRIGGVFSRTNFGDTAFSEIRGMEVDADVLLPMARAITLGAGFRVGTVDEAPVGFQNYGRMFFGLAFKATISFTDAKSLLELNRHLY